MSNIQSRDHEFEIMLRAFIDLREELEDERESSIRRHGRWGLAHNTIDRLVEVAATSGNLGQLRASIHELSEEYYGDAFSEGVKEVVV